MLVVAETVGTLDGFSALADRNGDYAIFNLAPGDYSVRAYAQGAVHEEKTAAVAADAVTDVDLAMTSAAPATVSGNVSLVNRGAGTGTSVILVVESTFDEVLLRGETPPGLRAPGPGIAPDLTGAWQITGVPPGRYVALAAFENDFLVRDPDVCQGGTEVVRFDVLDAQPVALDIFKITGSLDVIRRARTAQRSSKTERPRSRGSTTARKPRTRSRSWTPSGTRSFRPPASPA